MIGLGTAGFGGQQELGSIDMAKELAKSAGKVRDGDLNDLTDVLTTQAHVMDAMFTEFTRRAMMNMGEYPQAMDRYMNLALKAQNQCRTATETLARIKRGGKQTVKVVHVHEGGQAVVADNFNSGGQRGQFKRESEPVHEQYESGAQRAKMLGKDEAWNGLPVSGNPGKEKVQASRGPLDGSAGE